MQTTVEPHSSQPIHSAISKWARSETQACILSAGLRTFTHLGYGGTTITEIAKASGMSKPRVIYHFKDPDAVLVELAEIWGELGRTVTVNHLAALTTESLNERVVAMATAMFEWMRRFPEFAKLTAVLLQAASHNPRIALIQRRTFDTGRERVAEFLMKRPRSRLSAQESTELAQAIHLLMIGACLYVISVNSWNELDRIQRQTEDSIRSLLGEKR